MNGPLWADLEQYSHDCGSLSHWRRESPSCKADSWSAATQGWWLGCHLNSNKPTFIPPPFSLLQTNRILNSVFDKFSSSLQSTVLWSVGSGVRQVPPHRSSWVNGTYKTQRIDYIQQVVTAKVRYANISLQPHGMLLNTKKCLIRQVHQFCLNTGNLRVRRHCLLS